MSDTAPAGWDSPLFNLAEKTTAAGSWIYDTASRLFWFSENYHALFGRENANPLDSIADLSVHMYPDDRPFLDDTVAALHNGKVPPSCEYRLIRDHDLKYIRQSIYIFNHEGRRLVSGTWQDITGERKRDESILFFEKLVDASIDGIMVMDTSLTVLLWNSHNELAKGINRSSIIGKKLFEINPWIEKMPAVLEAINHALMGFASFVPASRDGDRGYYEDHYVPLKNEDGLVIGVLNISHDVAHRIKAEEELKELNRSLKLNNRELKQRNAELQVFSHITSHDFKEPLRRVYTAIEMLVTQETERFSEKGKQYFKQMQGAVQRIGLLADDILSYSRLEIEKTAFAEVNLQQVLELVLKRLEEPIKKTDALITSTGLPLYRGHKLMLVQLFQNLLSNAIKFHEEGHQPEVSVRAEKVAGIAIDHPDADPGASYVKVAITDNGIGFKRKYNERIFEVFMRVGKARFPGSGTGLTLAKKIAELHGGFITVESTPGTGSTFTCFLQEGL